MRHPSENLILHPNFVWRAVPQLAVQSWTSKQFLHARAKGGPVSFGSTMTTTAGNIPLEVWCHVFQFLPASTATRSHSPDDDHGGWTRTKRLGHRDWSILTRSFSSMRHAAAVCPHFVLDFGGWPLSVRDRLRDEHVEAMVTAMSVICGHVDLTLCTSLTPRALDIISSNPNLRCLTLAHTPAILGDYDGTSAVLGRLVERSANLEHLRIYNCGLGNISVAHDLLSIPKQLVNDDTTSAKTRTGLKSLSLQGCKIKRENPRQVFRNGDRVAASLASLSLTSCGPLSWIWVSNIAKCFCSLKALDITACDTLHPINFSAIGSDWNGLEVLRLRGCKSKIDDPTSFGKAFPKLKVLDVSTSDSRSLLSPELGEAIAGGCPDLEELYVANVGFYWYPRTVVTSCKKLKALDMSGDIAMNSELVFDELIENAGQRLEYFKPGDRISMTIAKKLMETCPKLRAMPLAGLRSISPLFNPLPLPNQGTLPLLEPTECNVGIPPCINSIEAVVAKLGTLNMAKLEEEGGGDKFSPVHTEREEWLGNFLSTIQPKLAATLPDQFLQFCRCWAGRFPIRTTKLQLLERHQEEADITPLQKAPMSFVLLNHYCNYDTIWLHVLDLEGKYGPKGGIIDLSSWDTHFETHGGFCDAIMTLHMTGDPDAISRDSYPIVYDDTLTFLNALLISTIDEIVDDISMVISGRTEYWIWDDTPCKYPFRRPFKAIGEFVGHGRWSHKLLMAAAQVPVAPDYLKELARRVVKKVLTSVADADELISRRSGLLGKSVLDVAVEKGNADLLS